MNPPEGSFNPRGVEATGWNYRTRWSWNALSGRRGNTCIHFLLMLCRSFTHWNSFKLEHFYHVAALQSQHPNRGCVRCRGRFVLCSCSHWFVSVLLLVNVKCHGQCFWPSLIDKHFSAFIPTQSHGHLHLFPPLSHGTSISASHSCYALKIATVLE